MDRRFVPILLSFGLALACEPADEIDIGGPVSGNHTPKIVSLAVEPATIVRGGSATVKAVAEDVDGVTFAFSALSGSIVAEPGILGQARYQHNGSATTSDTITVTVTDTQNSRATGSVNVTVTRPAEAAPTVSLVAAGAASCHPRRVCGTSNIQPCLVTFNASGSNYQTLEWSGCCAGSSDATGQCSVSALETHTCTVTARGPGGVASANAEAKGINSSPIIRFSGTDPASPIDCGVQFDVNFEWSDPDGDQAYSVAGSLLQGPCEYLGERMWPSRLWSMVRAPAAHTTQLCFFSMSACDGWVTVRRDSGGVVACP